MQGRIGVLAPCKKKVPGMTIVEMGEPAKALTVAPVLKKQLLNSEWDSGKPVDDKSCP
ncbi:hypothetical protein GCM10011404_13390 [Sphingomonas prati]|nr:hypothetical protein GCM10011404_13390 [Sphingomonas prati]